MQQYPLCWNLICQLTESDNQSVRIINIDSNDFNKRETRNSLARITISTQLPALDRSPSNDTITCVFVLLGTLNYNAFKTIQFNSPLPFLDYALFIEYPPPHTGSGSAACQTTSRCKYTGRTQTDPRGSVQPKPVNVPNPIQPNVRSVMATGRNIL